MRRPTRMVAVIAALTTSAALVATSASAATPTDSADLRDAVSVDGIMAHEEALQAIADANGGTRASGTPGYEASVDYVVDQLEADDYDVDVQSFDFPFFQELSDAEFERISPDAETYVVNQDFITMEFSGTGDVAGKLVPTSDVVVPTGAARRAHRTAAARTSDFAPARGRASKPWHWSSAAPATSSSRRLNAQEAGYDAVIIFNEGQDGRSETLSGTLGGTGVDRPGDRHQLCARSRARRATAGGRDRRAGQHRRPFSEHARDLQRVRGQRQWPQRPHRRRRCAPRLGDRGRRDQRQRLRLRHDPRDRRADGRHRHRAAQQRALRVVGRRGVRPARLGALRRGAVEEGAARTSR